MNQNTHGKLDELFDQHGYEYMLQINRQFILQQWLANKEFYCSHNPWEATGFFQEEVLYLIELGVQDFIPVEDGLWKAIR